MLFNRLIQATVLRGDGQSITIDEKFRMSFNVNKSYTVTENSLNVNIYNLNDNTVNFLQDRDGLLTISGGYSQAQGLSLISSGNITSIEESYAPPNKILSLTCADGITFNREVLISLSFSEATPVRTVLNAIINEIGATLRPLDFEIEGEFINGYSYYGPARNALDRVVKGKLDAEWSFQNNELQIIRRGQTRVEQAFILNRNTGLIKRPVRSDNVGERLLFDSYKAGWIFETLLLPGIEPGGLLQVESENVNGLFRVQQISHNGDNWGNEFNSIIEAVEVGLNE